MMNETSWDTVKRIDRSDPELEAMRSWLYWDLRPEQYERHPENAAIQQAAISKRLEERNQAERIHRAALAVAGFHTPGFQAKEAA
jgi:hypothetical protein